MNCFLALPKRSPFGISLTALLVLLPFTPGCGDQSPATPEVVVIQGTSPGADETSTTTFPSDARFLNYFLPGDATLVPLGSQVTPSLPAGSFIVFTRIDYAFTNVGNVTFEFSNSTNGTILAKYRLPLNAPSSGTFILTYPIGSDLIGGGLGFVYGINSSFGIDRARLSGAQNADFAVLYAWADPTP